MTSSFDKVQQKMEDYEQRYQREWKKLILTLYILFVTVGGYFYMMHVFSYQGGLFSFFAFLLWLAICYVVWLVKNIIVARIFVRSLKWTLNQQPKEAEAVSSLYHDRIAEHEEGEYHHNAQYQGYRGQSGRFD